MARRRFTVPVAVTRLGRAGDVAAFGGFIFYNTNMLNPYLTAYDRQSARRRITRRSTSRSQQRRSRRSPRSRLTVDLYPGEQRVRIKGATRW